MATIEIKPGFGKRLKKLRLEKGVTQEILAQEIHVTRQTISGWERGRSEPDLSTLLCLARFFDVTIDELLSMKGVNEITINYGKGGRMMLPFITMGIIIALVVDAPLMAICSIALFGYGAAIILILMGKRIKTPRQNKSPED